MKKAALRKLREISENILSKEETNRIIDETIKKTLDETKSKRKTKINQKKSDK